MDSTARCAIYLACVVSLSACDLVGSGDWAEPEPAAIAFTSGDSLLSNIVLPDTVDAGEAFSVRVTTYAGHCDRIDRTDVESFGDSAVIRPYDQPWIGQCTSEPQSLTHIATVTFDHAGTATITIVGVERDSRDTTEIIRHAVVR